jgi:hypothetical protein
MEWMHYNGAYNICDVYSISKSREMEDSLVEMNSGFIQILLNTSYSYWRLTPVEVVLYNSKVYRILVLNYAVYIAQYSTMIAKSYRQLKSDIVLQLLVTHALGGIICKPGIALFVQFILGHWEIGNHAFRRLSPRHSVARSSGF